jgi:enoyl-CoA hydratase/carnithine racemase
VTVTGSGNCFSSGNDVGDFLSPALKNFEASPAAQFLNALAQFGKPLIAGVNGIAIGIGVTLLLHCDLVYAADVATFQLPFTQLGVVPEAGSSQLLPQRVGQLRASELMLLGERFDAARALEIGLINQVVAAAELPNVLSARAALLASKPVGSLVATKALLRRTPDPIAVRMALESAQFARLLQSPETRAIMQAFLGRNKRG